MPGPGSRNRARRREPCAGAAVEASGLDWTIVRPGGLTDDPATGNYVAQTTSEGRPMKNRISRVDVAGHILQILNDPASYGQALAMGTH